MKIKMYNVGFGEAVLLKKISGWQGRKSSCGFRKRHARKLYCRYRADNREKC